CKPLDRARYERRKSIGQFSDDSGLSYPCLGTGCSGGPTPDLDGSAVTIDILLSLPEWAVHQQDATLGPNTPLKRHSCCSSYRAPRQNLAIEYRFADGQ